MIFRIANRQGSSPHRAESVDGYDNLMPPIGGGRVRDARIGSSWQRASQEVEGARTGHFGPKPPLWKEPWWALMTRMVCDGWKSGPVGDGRCVCTEARIARIGVILSIR